MFEICKKDKNAIDYYLHVLYFQDMQMKLIQLDSTPLYTCSYYSLFCISNIKKK